MKMRSTFACVVLMALTLGLMGCENKPAPSPTNPVAPATPASTTPPAASSQPVKTGSNDHHDNHGGGMEDREKVDADGVIRRGAKLSDATTVSVALAATKSGEYDGKNVKIQGKVEQVCQPMGCWFVMQGDTPAQSIRITSKGHDIFVPKSAAGKLATVEGEFKVKVLDKATAQHFEDERKLKDGEQRKVFTEDQKELSLSVTALEMKNPA
jgi:hypothetical protein